MKKLSILILIISTISLLSFFSCKFNNSKSEDNTSQDNVENNDETDDEITDETTDTPNTSVISKDYWGTWIRMDTGEVYKINDKTVTVNGESTSGIGFITKESENILKYGTDETAPRLFRKGGSNIRFTAQLAGFDTQLARAASMGMQGIKARRKNKDNESDKQEVVSDSEGVITFTDAVSEESQNIEVDTSSDTTVTVDVLPQYDGENIGTIPLVTSGKYALKTTYNINTKLEDYMYGNDYTEYDITLKIENISNEKCAMSFYTINSEDTNLNTTFAKTGNIRTLLPGRFEEITGKVSYGKLEDEYKDVVLNIKIEDGLTDDTWNDSITLRFYRGRVPLVVNAQVVGGSDGSNLNGFVIYPDSRSKWFSVKSAETSTIWIPYSKRDYTLVFSGATESSEMKYSFNFRNSSKLADLSGVVTRDEIRAYENNNTFDTSYNLGTFTDNIKAALIYGDLDYYKINNENELIGNLASIKVDSSSMRTSYYLNQSLNTEGLVVKAVYQGGQEVDISQYIKIGSIDMTTTGTKSLDISYTEDGITKSEKIYITVNDFSVSSIKIAQKPSKLIYYTEQQFDPSGIVVNATAPDGEIIDVTNSVEYEGFNSKTPVSSQTITVILEKNGSRFKDSFNIEMKQLVLESIRIDSKPTKIKYYTGQKLKCQGMKITALYNSGEEKDCTEKVTNDFDSSDATDSKVVTISYTENGITKNATFTVIIDSHPGTLSDLLIDDTVFNKTALVKVLSKKVSVQKSKTYGEDSAFYGESESVEIMPFEIGKYEVTQELYEYVIGRNPSEYKGADHPVDFVNLYDAMNFCNKLSELMYFEPVYYTVIDGNKVYTDDFNRIKVEDMYLDTTRNGFRLPSQAEWEFAARGGDESKKDWNYKYAGSDDIKKVGFVRDNYNYYNGPQSVGLRNSNILGLYDMSGNVEELCWPPIYVQDYNYGWCSVLKGGSWWFLQEIDENHLGHPDYYRNPGNSYDYVSYYGFRLARSVNY